MKIQIFGFSGSGKSTFAKRLGEFYNINVLHIDAISHLPNWVARDREKVEEEIKSFIKQDDWIIDGQYLKYAPERYEECDQLFMFQFNRIKCLYGVIKRCLKNKGKQRDSAAPGCKDNLKWSFIMWVIKDSRSKWGKKLNADVKLKNRDKIIIFKNRRQVNKYLQKIGYNNI